MAVPKKKVSKKKRDMRRYNIFLKLPVITIDNNSNKYRLRHHYNIKKIIKKNYNFI